MTAEEFRLAYTLARSNRDLSNFSFDDLYGFGLSDFRRVIVPIETVARCLRWQCQMMNGEWDGEALAECRYFFVYPSKRVEILAPMTCPHCGEKL